MLTVDECPMMSAWSQWGFFLASTTVTRSVQGECCTWPTLFASTNEASEMTRAIFEHAARISRVEKLEDLIRLNADFARDSGGGRSVQSLADG